MTTKAGAPLGPFKIWILVRAFIALTHFLYVDDANNTVEIKKHSIIADAKPILVFVPGQCFDVAAIRHSG